MSRVKDITGQRFGRLFVESRAANDNFGRANWNCICDCGGRSVVFGGNLRNGHTESCGCMQKEAIVRASLTHGMSNSRDDRSPVYGVWSNMKTRCYNPKTVEFHRYGGRGVYVCDEWRSDFLAFHSWCMENGFKDGLQIDRIDNDGPYEPDNCRFVTPTENIRNSSATKLNIETVREIRNRLDCGERVSIIHKEYGVDITTIYKIKANTAWKE